MCVVTWLHHLPGGSPAFFPATDSHGAPALCDQYRPQQVKKFILSFGGYQTEHPALRHPRQLATLGMCSVSCPHGSTAAFIAFTCFLMQNKQPQTSVAPEACVFFTCIAHPSVGWLLLCSCVCTIFVLGWS